MLRLRRNMEPRVPNIAAVLSAVLLTVTAFVGTGESAPAGNTPVDWLADLPQASAEAAKEELSEPQNTVRKGFKISLMMFH